MVNVSSSGRGLLVAECDECGWLCVGAPSDHFTHAVNRHVGEHRADVITGIADRIAQMRAHVLEMARDEGWTTLRLVRTLDAMQLPPLLRACAR